MLDLNPKRAKLPGPILLSIVIILLAAAASPGCITEETTAAPDLIYLTEDFPPFNYEEQGEIKGIGVEILQAVYQEMGLTLPEEHIQIGLFTPGFNTALTTPGYVFFSAARTPEREDHFLWAGPIGSYPIIIYGERGRDIRIETGREINQFLIGAVQDDVSVGELIRAGVFERQIITHPDPLHLIRMLDAGEIDLIASGDVAGDYLIEKAIGRTGYFIPVYTLTEVDLYYAFNRDTPESFVRKFQSALDALALQSPGDQMSRFDRILARYLPSKGLATLTYATEDYYPYNYQEDGRKKGISIEIIEEVFSDLNTGLSRDQVSFLSWEEGYQRTLTIPGHLLFSTARTAEREDLFLWAGPILRSRNVLFMREGEHLPEDGDLVTLSFGAIQDDIAGSDLRARGLDRITYATGAEELIAALEEGTIDAWAYAEYPGMNLIDRYAQDPGALTVAYILDTHEYYIACNRETPLPLVRAIQQAIDRIRSEKDEYGVSRYERILYRYLTPSYAGDILREDDAIGLVERTAEAIADDAPATIRAINAGIHPYRDAEKPGLYVFAYDTDVVMVAHADNIHLVGVSFKGKTDVTGKAFRDAMVAGALADGSGWEEYIYINPAESGLFWKSTYYMLAEGSDGRMYIICSGIFKTA